MDDRKYYIETYGCQMNEYDSELIAGILESFSYQPVNTPNEADIILVNTCSVREHAENRALSRLNQFASLKKSKPDLIIGLLGCVAQQNRERVFSEKPFIDLVLGPDSYRRLPDILNGSKPPLIDVKLSKCEVYDDLLPARKSSVNAWVSIIRGCDKFCSFCIVPFVRGRERSRIPEDIVQEVILAVKNGYKEITLLGQNVNSYRFGANRFPELLETIAAVPGVERIRFTSPYPNDIDDRMLEVMSEHKNICKHIHLPLQAGSTRVLKLMNRQYSQEEYLAVVDKVRERLPECSITTDIIVGFPGETELDFLETLNVMDSVVFDSAFMFKYSPRPLTKAASMRDSVTEKEKSERLERVVGKQKKHTLKRNQVLVGTVQEILVDGESKKNSNEKRGRTDTNKIVIIKKGNPEIGDIVSVEIKEASGVSLMGEAI